MHAFTILAVQGLSITYPLRRLGATQAMARGFHHYWLWPSTDISRHIYVNAQRRGLQISRTNLSQSVNGDANDLSRRTTQILPAVPQGAHRVIFLRHGESEFNNANIFTGWCDVALTQRGVVESIEAGQVFASHDLTFRKCYCSLLTRSIVTAHRALEAAGIAYTPTVYDWRLNERHYGALQGLSKERTAERLGRELVMRWRRSYAARPPPMLPDHPHFEMIQKDPRYSHLTDIPSAESLEDCQVRAVRAWNDIVASMQQNSGDGSGVASSKNSLVVAHANTLRALVMHLDGINADEIEALNIPTAIPFYYDIHMKTGEVISDKSQESSLDRIGVGRFRGIYIADERKKRSFLERRRAANDPFLWALHDYQVGRSMLLNDSDADRAASDEMQELDVAVAQNIKAFEKEADENTKMFSPNLGKHSF
ncbi:hypothetical protein ACA910_019681 [Epithemia clementina (nom. ined.)]